MGDGWDEVGVAVRSRVDIVSHLTRRVPNLLVFYMTKEGTVCGMERASRLISVTGFPSPSPPLSESLSGC